MHIWSKNFETCEYFMDLNFKHFISSLDQGSGNFEIWIGPADDDVINEPISKKKKKNVFINCHEN